MGVFAERNPAYRVFYQSRSLMVEDAPDSIAKVAELHSLHGPDLLRKVNPAYAGQLQNVSPLEINELRVASKLEHEIDHVQRVHGTTLGILLSSVWARKVHAWFQAAAEASSGDTPLVEVFKIGDAYQEYCELEDLEFCLLCDAVGVNGYERVARSAVLDILGEIGGSSVSSKTRLGLAMPTIGYGGRSVVIGAQSLLESFAVTRESSLTAFSTGAGSVESYKTSPLHQIAYHAWKYTYSLPLPHSAPSTDAWTHSGLRPGLRFPLEFYLALDLALWLPLLPTGWAEGLSWEDVHPGWRFLQILDYLKHRSEDYLTFDGPESVDDQYVLEKHERWCRDLEWPSPCCLRSAWQSVIRDKLDSGLPLKEPWMMADDRGTLECLANYFYTRERYPSLSILSFLRADGHHSAWFQLLTTIPADSAADGSTLDILLPEATSHWYQESGYHLPPNFSIPLMLSIIATRLDGGARPRPRYFKDFQEAVGKRLMEDTSNYAVRNYGFKMSLV